MQTIKLVSIFVFSICFLSIYAQKTTKVQSYQITGKYGLKDSKTGEQLISENYEFLDFYLDSASFIAKKQGKFGLINLQEQTILDFEFDTIIPKIFSNDALQVYREYGIVKKDTLYGLIDSLGRKTTEVAFDDLPHFYNHNGISLSKNGKFGAIDMNGETLIPFEFDRKIGISGNLLVVSKNEKMGVYDIRKGMVLSPQFDYVFSTGQGQFFIAKLDNKKGVFDANGVELIPMIYKEVSLKSHKDFGYFFKVKLDKQEGIFDSKGNVIIPVEYQYINTNHSKYFVVSKNDKKGLINMDGSFAYPLIFKDISFHNNGKFKKQLTAYRTEARGYVLQEDGTHYDTLLFDDYHKFHNDYIFLKKEKRIMIADWFGNIKEGTYDDIDCDYRDRRCIVELEEKYGQIDYQGNITIPLIYNGLRDLGFDKTFFVFWDDNYKTGVLTKEGNVILPAKYEKVEYNKDARRDPIYAENIAFNVQQNGLWGLVTSEDEFLIPCEYDQLFYFNRGRCPAKKDGLWGIIDKNNEPILDFQYKEIRLSERGIKEVKIGEEWLKVDAEGKVIK